MVAVSVLSLGLVMVYQAFFSSLNSIGLVANRLNANNEIANTLWEMDDINNRSIERCDFPAAGRSQADDTVFAWKVSPALIDGTMGLYKLEVTFSWLERGKKISLTRWGYVGR